MLKLLLSLLTIGALGVWLLVAPDAPPQPVAVPAPSRGLAFAANGTLLVVVNPDSDSVSLVDTAGQQVLAEVPVGDDPRAVAADDRLAYVVSQGNDSLSVIDLVTATVVATAPAGHRPVGVSLSPDGRVLAVAAFGEDAVLFLHAKSGRTLSVHHTADRPHGLVFTADGRYLLVTHLLDGHVTALPFRPFLAFLPAVAAPNGSAGGSGTVSWPRRFLATWPNVAPAPAIALNAAGTRAYLPQTMANGQRLNTNFNTTVFPKVSVLNLETWSHQSTEHVSLPETVQPVGLPWDAAVTPSGTELWVVNAASNDVSVVDISVPTFPVRAASIPVGANPRAILIANNGQLAYVNNTLDGTVSVIDTTTYTVTAVITTTAIPLPPILIEGKRIFHSSADPRLARAQWISCNTCHIEGEHDGRTWVLQYLGEVAPGATPVITRNTTSLLGMIETYPLRWSAEWDESADSEFSIRMEQYGSGLIDGDMHPTLGLPNQGRSAALDSLAAFIDGLQTPGTDYRPSPSIRRGGAIFSAPETACQSCHPPPLYTDLLRHDVGTAAGPGEWFGPSIDTPTLRFLRDSAPFLHDGSAPTLLAVLTTANPADTHGRTSHLTDSELADLVRFLEALPLEREQP
jgi:YVTN family beta-propeller protein